MAKFVTLIAGNICAGKTNKLNYIKHHQDLFTSYLNLPQSQESLCIVPEFIDPIARHVFYRNRKENSAIYEYSCLIGRIARHLKARGDEAEPDNNLYFFDRGIIEGAETFARNSHQEGFMTKTEFTQYTDVIKMSLDRLGKNRQHLWLEQLIVYLEVKDEKILQERYQQRSSTTNEEPIPLDYFKRINEKYHHFFENINTIYEKYGVNPPQVLKIDASINGNHHNGYHKHTINQIIQKMQEMKLK